MNNRQATLLVRALSRPMSVNANIEVKRAPTDESIRLFKEFREKAEADVVKATNVSSNEFNCVVHHMHDDMSARTTMRAVFELNGKKLTASAVLPTCSADLPTYSAELARALRDEIARKIADECIGPAIRSMGH